ncbi:MAG: hypothetical protein IKI35_05350 [Stomatobaculum sp.]|nr:hypothetical protein [Stomatobaculum sp.]
MSSSVRTNSKSSLFLIELIVTLCFFSLASVVCVRLFVYAHKVSTESRRETLAIQISQNAAECFIAADGDPEEFRRLFNMTLPQDREDIITDFTITRKGGNAPAEAAAGSPAAEGTSAAAGSPAAIGRQPAADEDGVMCRLLIRNTAVDGTGIFSLEVLHYRQKGSAGESEAANEQ